MMQPQLQTITGLTAGQENVNLLKHVKHSEDAIHIFTLPSPSFKLANTVSSALDKKVTILCKSVVLKNKQFKKSLR